MIELPDPDFEQRLARLVADVRIGSPVVIREGSAAHLVAAAETAGDGVCKGFRTAAEAGRAVHLAVTAHRARTLAARAYDGDIARIALPARSGARWIRAVADPSMDLDSPMKGPFMTLREGPADVGRAAIALCKHARLLPAALVADAGNGSDLPDRLSGMPLGELVAGLADAPRLERIASSRVPLAACGLSKVHLFRHGGDEHCAIEVGNPPRVGPVLTRLHSACFTGDLLGSLKCDCGAQLRAALDNIGRAGAGVLLYLSQEGRGIGLANKLRAYALQDQGFDTVEANHRLGFEDDERDFRIGAEILHILGFDTVDLMTNNPAKVEMMMRSGIEVRSRVPLAVGRTAENADYLDTKARRSGHIL